MKPSRDEFRMNFGRVAGELLRIILEILVEALDEY